MITALLMIVEMLGRMKRDKTKYGKASFERHAASRLFRCVNHNVCRKKSFWQNIHSIFQYLEMKLRPEIRCIVIPAYHYVS